MILQEALHKMDMTTYIQTMEKWRVSENEQKHYIAFIESLKERKAGDKSGRLLVEPRVYDYGEGEWEELEAFLVFEGDKEKYALDFIPWEECLGYTIDEESVNKHGLEEMLLAILYDMTFDGFDEKGRNEALEELKGRIDEIETDEKVRKGFNSLEDVWAAMDEKKQREEGE